MREGALGHPARALPIAAHPAYPSAAPGAPKGCTGFPRCASVVCSRTPLFSARTQIPFRLQPQQPLAHPPEQPCPRLVSLTDSTWHRTSPGIRVSDFVRKATLVAGLEPQSERISPSYCGTALPPAHAAVKSYALIAAYSDAGRASRPPGNSLMPRDKSP
jgi:hypothetical protein